MLLLSFRMGEDRYALDASSVVEITPLVQLRKIPQSPEQIAGVFNYRGTPIPILDLAYIIQGRACNTHLSTRIILFKHKTSDQKLHIVGFMAEQVTETIKRSMKNFINPGVLVENAPYLQQLFKNKDYDVSLSPKIHPSIRENI